MRGLVQRVGGASVVVDGEVVGSIGRGLLLFVGVHHDDGPDDAERLAGRVATLRVFPDPDGEGSPFHRSVSDLGLGVLVVSQFTLYGDTTKGRRPSWHDAARPDHAEPLVDAVAEALRGLGLDVACGVFGAHMDVSLVNDGPVTLLLET